MAAAVSEEPRRGNAISTRLARRAVLASAVAAFALDGCAGSGDDGASAGWSARERAVLQTLGPAPVARPSPSNQWADDEDAAALGRQLFYDKRFSANGEVACATCHDPAKAFSDGRALAEGVGVTGRHAPTVLGAASSPWQFWDGRADSLWAQALGPIESPVEHGFGRVAVAHVLAAHYRSAWEPVFGALPGLEDKTRFPPAARPVPDQPDDPAHVAWMAMAAVDRDAVDAVFARFGKAIEAYERRLMGGEIALDRYVAAVAAGDDSGGGHLSAAAVAGLRVFIGEGGCVSCHAGARLSNGAFHNIGLAQPAWAAPIDRGRYDGATAVAASPFNCLGAHSDAATSEATNACGELPFLTQNEVVMLGAFKTPGLRSVALTAPFMHAGQYATLEEVVDHYDHIEDHEAPIGPKESFLRNLALSASQRAGLVALLQTFDAGPADPAWVGPTAP